MNCTGTAMKPSAKMAGSPPAHEPGGLNPLVHELPFPVARRFAACVEAQLDVKATKAMAAGSFIVIPKGTRHFVWARGKTIVQLHPIEPSGPTSPHPPHHPTNRDPPRHPPIP